VVEHPALIEIVGVFAVLRALGDALTSLGK
jgi:hypothetical protein